MRNILARISPVLIVLFVVFVPLGMSTVRGNTSVQPNIALAAACTTFDAAGLPVEEGTVVQLPGGISGCKDPSGKIFAVDLNNARVEVNEQGDILDQNGNPTGTKIAQFAARPLTCTGFIDCILALPSALWQAAVTLLAGTLIEVSRWFLIVAGTLFNWLVENTIIQFGAWYLTIKGAVETAWTAFRDIANIFIIGIFTYVAISIILGLKDFGQKKMIASVLIVAVLINFSLLFTKMVIDVSNYTAAQIYTAAALGGTATTQGGQAGAATPGTSYGIATQFMNLLGVGTFGDAFKVVDNTAQAKDSGWAALLHGILVMAVILGAAMVLFYGCFLLISRMIMLIFLMVTAAIAVASYLIPDWGTSNYGFKAWKSSLIWCVTFAPMLMIFLWMTLNVSYALRGTSKATLGAALSDPAGGKNIEALFTYVLVLGLLFTTFKLSSMWANKIGGFNFAQMVPGIGLGLAGMLTGALGRNLIGGPASARLSALRDRTFGGGHYDDKGNWVPGTKGYNAVNRFAATRLAGLQKATFNPLKTKLFGAELGASAAKALGVPKFLSGAKMGEGGFSGVMARKAKAADDLARAIGPTGDQRESSLRLTENETRRARKEQVTQMNTLIKTQKDTREGLLNRQPGARDADTALTQARNALTTREHERDIAGEEHASRLRIQEARAANAQDPAEQQNANTEIQRLNAERREAMAGEAHRIEVAQRAVTDRQQIIDQNHPEIAELTRTIDANTRTLGNNDTPGTLKYRAAEKQVKSAAKGAELKADVALREKLLWDPRASAKIRDEMKAHQRRQNWADFNAAVPAAERGGGDTPPAAPAAPGPVT